MESMSRSERAALCNTALQVGELAPTLCGDWTVKELVIHLLVRERDPLGAPGILFPPLEKLTDRSARRLQEQDFTALVERVRGGPPRWSPLSIPPLEKAVNTLEYFVHHEDIRRAGPGWIPRELTEREQRTLWSTLGTAGKGLVRRAGVPVQIRWDEADRSAVLRKGDDPAVVSGPPAELVMFLFGRDEHTGLEFAGPEARLEQQVPPTLFMPHAQLPASGMTVAVRTASDPLTLAAAIREAVARSDPGMALAEMKTERQQIAETIGKPRALALLTAVSGTIGLLLACVGLYGVVSYETARRTQEIGIRMALGAGRADVLRLVMRQIVVVLAIGSAMGLALALAASRLMGSLLFGIAPTDPLAIGSALALLIGVALAASYLPARRAARLDPTQALRYEG